MTPRITGSVGVRVWIGGMPVNAANTPKNSPA
jgi:hypothetical protein